MKFFTKEWLGGELTDAAFEAVPGAYRRHLTSLRLPPDVLALAEAESRCAGPVASPFGTGGRGCWKT